MHRRILAVLVALAAVFATASAVAPATAAPPSTATAAPAPAPAPAPTSAHTHTHTHTVTYDHYSLKIDGKRTLIRSAEFHYFRLPEGAPEAAPSYDDTGWQRASEGSGTALTAEAHGFLYGSVWYRGRFTATGEEAELKLNALTGKRGRYLVWVDGRYAGSAAGGVQADADAPANPDPGPGTFELPALRPGQEAVVSVLVQNMGHNDDWTADDNRFKQPRGLLRAALTGSETPIAWRIQGGDPTADPLRGPLNAGGLYGERTGLHLPGGGSPSDWSPARTDTVAAGTVTWRRSTFRLHLPKGQDVPLALHFAAEPPPGARVLIHVNGWKIGQYGKEIGPQNDFTVPAGLLRPHGTNTVTLAVIADDGATLAPPTLVAKGNAWTGGAWTGGT